MLKKSLFSGDENREEAQLPNKTDVNSFAKMLIYSFF